MQLMWKFSHFCVFRGL